MQKSTFSCIIIAKCGFLDFQTIDMSTLHQISSEVLELKTIHDLLLHGIKIQLSEASKKKVKQCRTYLDSLMQTHEAPIYGINTGFGSLYNVKISKDKLTELQENLVMSHACGIGDTVPNDIVKLMLLLKIQSLSYGNSGVQLSTVERLIDFYNNDILPVVYTQGSLGASGDLAPLAHLCLPLIGKGSVWYQGEIVSGEAILEKFGWQPLKLQSKEGLALLNGTQFMSAYGVYLVLKSHRLSYFADLIGCISLEAFDGRIEPFDALVHKVRPHKGQVATANRFRRFLDGSELIKREKLHVQDPYSFRCIPQVHGATKDALNYVENVFRTEINSVTDNPNIFMDEDRVISGGNFHGQPLALALDHFKIALAELGNISERRIFQLVSGLRGLPTFLVDSPGLNSGFMIPQYTAASIVSANKQLASPASVDSIVSSNGQEDHVSMGANAATQAYKLANNVEKVLAIELFNAVQALEFRKPVKSSIFIESFVKHYREKVGFVSHDKVLHDLMVASLEFLQGFKITDGSLFD